MNPFPAKPNFRSLIPHEVKLALAAKGPNAPTVTNVSDMLEME